MMLYSVEVQFNSDLLEIQKNTIRIGVKSKPIKGNANKEIIKRLAKHFQVPSSSIVIKTGHRSKTKIVEVLKQ